jgi:hypothetical protein
MQRLLLASLSAAAVGCGQLPMSEVCPAVAAAGLTVEVSNAATSQPICDATVTATDGSYTERLTQASPCSYLGAFERLGTYQVRAERPGFISKQVGPVLVTMENGQCPHVRGVRVTIPLAPG